jgi:peptidoglycan/LPS O-acetylase OafA/YrhL
MTLFLPILSFFLCILTASYLSKTSRFSFLNSRKNRFRSLDGIRGFLALSVFFHHFVITYYWKTDGAWVPPPQDIFQNLGKVGVAVFFMITGFLFISKIASKDNKINWLKLYQSRVFRIIPLYLFALSIITSIVFVNSDFQLNVTFISLLKQYLRWGMFVGGSLNDFADTRLIIAGVDWTLKYEWLFYFSLPIVALLLKKFKKIGVMFIITGSIILFFFPISMLFFSTKYIIYFCVGGLSSYIFNHFKPNSQITGKIPSTINLILILTAIFYPNTLDAFHVVIISSLFILTLLGNDLYGLFSLRASIVLGEISYSIYLLHGIVLYGIFTIINPIEFNKYNIDDFLILMPLMSVLVVIVSATTFLLIEKPCIEFGRKLRLGAPFFIKKNAE